MIKLSEEQKLYYESIRQSHGEVYYELLTKFIKYKLVNYPFPKLMNPIDFTNFIAVNPDRRYLNGNFGGSMYNTTKSFLFYIGEKYYEKSFKLMSMPHNCGISLVYDLNIKYFGNRIEDLFIDFAEKISKLLGYSVIMLTHYPETSLTSVLLERGYETIKTFRNRRTTQVLSVYTKDI